MAVKREDKAAGASMKAASAASPVASAGVCQVAVLAYPGTSGLMERLWKKFCSVPFKVVGFEAGSRLTDSLARLVADTGLADEFALLPADMIPCCAVDMDDLSAPWVYWAVSPEGFRYDDRYPMKFTKAGLVETLADESACASDEKFLSMYYAAYRHRPLRCGYNVGNLVMPVRRGNPCEWKVIEAFMRYRFVSATPEGFTAVAPLAEKYLLG